MGVAVIGAAPNPPAVDEIAQVGRVDHVVVPEADMAKKHGPVVEAADDDAGYGAVGLQHQGASIPSGRVRALRSGGGRLRRQGRSARPQRVHRLSSHAASFRRTSNAGAISG